MRVAVNLRPLVSHYVQQLRTTTGISPLNTASQHHLPGDIQLPADRFDRLPLNQRKPAYLCNRLHNQHPKRKCLRSIRRHFDDPNLRGPVWTKITPQQGSQFHERSQPNPETFKFTEIYYSGLFIHHIIEDLLKQRRDLASTVGRLEEQIGLNEQYLGIIEQILSLTNKTALHISPTGHLTWYNRNEALLGFLTEMAMEKSRQDLRDLLSRLETAREVRKITHKHKSRSAPAYRHSKLFEIDVELRDDRILQLVGIDLGESGQALMISDETEVRALAQDLFQKQKLESLGILTSGVAHDMNNILAILSASIELELSRDPTPETERNLKTAKAAIGQGTSVVRSLLAFSRKSKATVSVESAAVILRDLEVVLEGKVGSEITVTCSVEAEDAFVNVGRPRLTNSLLNLAINASDAIGEKGHIRLTLRNASAGDDLPVGAINPENFVIFSIEDDGPGIPEHIRHRIMDPFFTTKAADKGTGLGLSLVYKAVEDFGGNFSFHSETGQGSCFMITLPRAPSGKEEPPPAATVGQKVSKGTGQSILLIDDEPGLIEIPRIYLEDYGYEVTTATSVSQATEVLAASNGFDVVVTDLRLGDGTGADVARLVKSKGHDSTIILISGNMCPSSEHLALMAA